MFVGQRQEMDLSYTDLRLLQKRRKDGSWSCKYQDMDTCLRDYLNSAQMELFGCTVPWNTPNDR